MVDKSLELNFQTNLHSIVRFSTEKSPKSKNGTNESKALIVGLPFFQFSFVATLSHLWYQDWFKVDLACFQAC